MKQTLFTGTATALLTPFTEDKRDVDYRLFSELLAFQLNSGVNGLVINGTTGEAPVLTQTERTQSIRLAVLAADGKIPVIAGTGSNNTAAAVQLSNEAEKEGVNGLLIVTPYYNKCTQESVIKHYFYIADRVSTPIIVYHVPSRTGVTLAPQTYKALSEHKNIVAVKEASPDLSAFAKAITLCGDDLTFYSGNDDLTLPMMAMGAKGLISVLSNIYPKAVCRLTSFLLQNQMEEARALQNRLLPVMNAMFIKTNPIPVKAAAEYVFNKPFPLRLPLEELNRTDKETLFGVLKRFSEDRY